MLSITKRGGVYNPAAYVLCEVEVNDVAQNVMDGKAYPLRLCIFCSGLKGLLGDALPPEQRVFH